MTLKKFATRAMALVAVGASMFLTGCSSADKPSQLVVWVDQAEATALATEAQNFEKQTGVKVELVVKDNARAELTDPKSKATKPDVIAGGYDWVGELAGKKLIKAIDLGLAAGGYSASALKAFNYSGKLYGVPYTADSSALICRVDKMPKAPTSWQQVKKAGFEMLFFAGQGATDLYAIQASFGATIFKTDGNSGYKAELNMGGKAGDAFAKWLADNRKLIYSPSPSYDGAINALKNGEVACWLAGTYVASAIDLRSGDYAIYAIPAAGEKPATPFSNARGYLVSASTKDQALAQKFITDYATKADAVAAIYQATNRIPAVKAALDSLGTDPVAKGFAAAAEQATPIPLLTEMASVWTPWVNAEVQILQGKGDAVKVWRSMVAEVSQAIKPAN